jgi:hypothetical protein
MRPKGNKFQRRQVRLFKIAHHGTERTIIARPRPNALADVALGAKEANTLSTSLQLVAGDPVIAPPGQ